MFEAIDRNKRKTIFIVFIFVALLAAVFAAVGYINDISPALMVPAAVVFSIFMSIGTYYNSDKIVLAISGARPADEREHAFIRNSLEGLCIAAGMATTVPRLYVIDDSAPNAFATGRNPENAVICVTTGLLDKLEMYEIEGVLAHELAHVKNYDILLSTIITVFVGIVTLLSDWILRGGFGRRRSSDRDKSGISGIIMLIGIVLLILSPIIAQFMRLALSRNREYLADATAIEFTRNPDGLINALKKISDDREPLEAANKATANLYIANPFKGEEESWIKNLYATHPPIPKRIEALKNLY